MRCRISYDHDPAVLPIGKWDLRLIDADKQEHYVTCFPSRDAAHEAANAILKVWDSYERQRRGWN